MTEKELKILALIWEMIEIKDKLYEIGVKAPELHFGLSPSCFDYHFHSLRWEGEIVAPYKQRITREINAWHGAYFVRLDEEVDNDRTIQFNPFATY